ncbi:MAG: GvpL/GvpF family gas vesicle protein [Actinomycetota bacterium]|nr:GvpL/GvpF family gas vesicle protein [Actinomycetota bacterium]
MATDSVGDLVVPDGGLKGAPVTAVSCGEVAAIVSPLESERVRSSRADLSAHARVVEFVASGCTILPLQFGVVMPSEGAVIEDLLGSNGEGLSLLVDEMAAKAEHRLKATYLGDVALRDAVDANPSIRRLQQKVRSLGEAASYHHRIQLGELVSAGLEQVKADDAAMILGRLRSWAVSTLVLPARRDDVAVHVAFLVDVATVQRFDEAIDAVAEEFGHRMSFEVIGPLAPWDFVTQDLVAGQEPLPASTTPGRR